MLLCGVPHCDEAGGTVSLLRPPLEGTTRTSPQGVAEPPDSGLTTRGLAPILKAKKLGGCFVLFHFQNKAKQNNVTCCIDTVKIFILGRNKTGTPQKIVDCSSFVPYQHCFGGVSVPCQKKRGVRRIFFAQRCTMHLGGVGMGIKILPQQNCSGPEQNWDTPKNPKCSSFVPVQYTSVSE